MNPNVPQYKEVVMQLVQMWVGDIEAHRSDQMELTPENEVKAEAWVRDDFRDNLEARQHEALNSIILYIKEKEVQASIDDIDDEFSDEEDDFGWIYVQEYENMEVHITVDGTLNLNCENLSINPSSSIKPPDAPKPEEDDRPGMNMELNMDTMLENVQAPEVEFGEDVEDD